MSQKEKKVEKKKSNKYKDVYEEWAVNVIRNLRLAADTVTLNPDYYVKFTNDVKAEFPNILEAFMILIKDRYRGEVWALIKSVQRMMKKLGR